MNDDQLELANAYLDGEVTPEERAVVESDAALLAEVNRLSELRVVLGAVDRPSDSARESAIAAALAAFDAATSSEPPAESTAAALASAPAPDGPPVTPPAPANVTSLDARRRVRLTRGLSAAAAALIVVAGAVVINQRGDDDSTQPMSVERDDVVTASQEATDAEAGGPDGTASAPTDAPMMVEAPVTTTPPNTTPAAATTTALSQTDAASQAEAADADADADADGGAAETETEVAAETDSNAQAPAPPPNAAAPSAATAARPDVVIEDANDLIAVAEALTVTPPDVDAATADCADGLLRPDGRYDDASSAPPVPVAVVTTDDAGGLAALELDDCRIVLRAQGSGG